MHNRFESNYINRNIILRILITLIISIITIFLSIGCQSSSITKEQAITTAKIQHEQNNDFGEIKIISVTHNQGEYEVHWERKSNCKSGTDYVNDKNGKLTHGMHQIC